MIPKSKIKPVNDQAAVRNEVENFLNMIPKSKIKPVND